MMMQEYKEALKTVIVTLKISYQQTFWKIAVRERQSLGGKQKVRNLQGKLLLRSPHPRKQFPKAVPAVTAAELYR